MVRPYVHPEPENIPPAQFLDLAGLAVRKGVQQFMVAPPYALELGPWVIVSDALLEPFVSGLPLDFSLPSVLAEVPGILAL